MKESLSVYQYTIKRERTLQIAENANAGSPAMAYELLKVIGLDNEEQEQLVVILLDSRHAIKGYSVVAVGEGNQCMATAKTIYRLAVMNGTTSIILAHNHPSGDTSPSNHDMNMTSDLKKAGSILGICLLDHIIVGNGYFSFLEEGLI